LTTVPPDVLDTNTVMALYKLRWQVELFIKRLKSILDIDKLRCGYSGRP
jgi:IS4 transposase